MLCLKKRRTYSFTQGVCSEHTRRAKKESNNYGGPLNSAITTLPRKNRNREERPSRMVLTVTEDTPADMLAGSMELLVQLPREHHLHTQKVTVQRSTPMMDLLVQIATAHKLAASSYTLQAIGERGLVLPHQPNTPIGALDALQVKLLPKQGTFVPRKTKQANQPFETTFRLQVHLPRNQLYVSRVSPKMNLGEILDEVCREKNLDRSKYELRHPANLEETLDLSLSLQDYHLQEVTLYAKQGRSLGSALSTQDIMALQRQEERRRHQAKQGVFGFIFKKSKESSLSTDSLGGRSTSPARSDETARSTSPLQPPARPQRKRRPAPKPPAQNSVAEENASEPGKDKVVISHSRNSSDSSGYHEASVLSDNPDSAGRLPETLPRRNRAPGAMETPRKLAHTSQSSKSLGNLATVSGTLSHAASSTSLSSTGLRKKRAAPPPPASRPLSSAISSQALERIVDSEESLTSDMEPSKPPSDIGASSKACSDIEERPKASSDIGVSTVSQISSQSIESKLKPASHELELKINTPPVPQNPIPPGPVEVGQPEVPGTPEAVAANLEHCTPELPAARVTAKRADIEPGPLDTEVLLQKVSDTLLNSLPLNEDETNPPRSKSEIPLEKIQPTPVSLKESKDTQKKSSGQVQQDTTESLEEVPLNNSAGSGTATSQQDTSDYVSAVDEDLSIPDWEYQLPAPPSAFRDRNSPVFDEYDTITLGSVEAFKDPIAEIVDDERTNKISNDKPLKRQEKDIRKDMVEEKPVKHLKKSDSNVKLQKEMICELENKIVSGTMSQGIRETDSRKVDILSTPKVAPVDNTLANFTITTYSRPKSVNIFDEVDHSANNKVSDDRFMRSFPTLTRNRINYENDVQTKDASNAVQRSKAEFVSLNDVELRKPQPKREEVSERCQSVKGTTEKVTVQRSRSYISSSESTRHTIHENDTKCDDSGNASGELDKKKSTSTVTLANMHKGNEKFSQWRENILKRQEEPTKEKQLQSLQVLKSILPQLKSAQQPEENVSKETSETVLTEKLTSETGSNEHSTETNVVSTRESQKPSNPTVEVESKKVAPEEKQVKKYTYSGPPAISLGSWSERPTLNVQIKKDTDYKFGGVHKTIGGKTIVNLNGLKDERTAENVLNKEELVSDKKNPSDLARKLITHTTASGFKKPVLNRVNVEARPVDKPVVTGVELKKTFTEKNESYKNNDSAIDTSPVDFRELSRAFGQDVCLRPKPKRLNPNRRTEHFDSNPESLQKLDSIIKQNGHCDIQNSNTTTSESSTKPKRFTSVVGITQSNTSTQATNFPFRSGITVKSNVAMPVVKGFKISSAKTNETQKVANGTVAGTKSIPQPPKPPTMPVITGVTLKSARPKSMPVQIEPRDMLLESIRNFGGRENLKSASGTC